MAQVNKIRYFYFRISDVDGNPVAGRKVSDLTITFTRDDVVCSDAYALNDLGLGRYSISYTPGAEGTDYFEIVDIANDFDHVDVETINSNDGGDSSEIVVLSESYGTGLRLSAPSPQEYTIYVFPSPDWDNGNRNPAYAVGISSLDVNGNWLTKIQVLSGTYHVVAIGSRATYVIAPYLKV